MQLLLNDTQIAAAGSVLDARTAAEITAIEAAGGIVVTVSDEVGARLQSRFALFRSANASRDSDILTLLALDEGVFDQVIPSPPSLRATTGTEEALTADDDGNTVTFNNAAAIDCTIPAGLRVGFSCALIQLGAGTVTIVAAGGVTLTAPLGADIARQGGAAGVTVVATDVVVAGGDLTT